VRQAVELKENPLTGNDMSNNKRSIDPAIIAALIGVMGTICVTVITLYANRVGLLSQPQPTPFPTWTTPPTATITDTPVPTDTVPPGDPSSTPAPDTPTPEPSFTPAPPAIGSDWANGCISVLWKPYPADIQTTENDGCLAEPVHVFFAADGRLTFLVTGKFDNTQVYGMFAPIPANGTVSINTFLRALQEGEIWMGVFAAPDIESQGMVIVIPPGNVKQRVLVQKTMPGQVEVQQTAQFAKDPPLYDVVFELSNGAVTTKILRDTVFNAIPVGAGQQWLFVGYQVKKGNNRIDAEFLNLFVQGQ
jgi:hypothetical protein